VIWGWCCPAPSSCRRGWSCRSAGYACTAAECSCPDTGTPAGPFGSVPADVSAADATHSARLTALAVLAGVRRAVGDLDRIGAWLTVTGFVNAEPGYDQTTAVLNGFSEVVLDVFGPDVGDHARTAIGVAALPLNLPVVVAAELELA